jgi:acylphosphatase
VRNRSDGTVEAVLAGDASLIQGILTASRKGPPVSCVKKIDTTEAGENDLALRTKGETFSVLPTI